MEHSLGCDTFSLQPQTAQAKYKANKTKQTGKKRTISGMNNAWQ